MSGNWCLEAIILHATGRKMWGEWVSEPGLQPVSTQAQADGVLVSFLCTGKSYLSGLGCKVYIYPLGGGRMGKDGRKEASTGKVLPRFWFLSYPWLSISINTSTSEIACFHVNVNSCSIVLPVLLPAGT